MNNLQFHYYGLSDNISLTAIIHCIIKQQQTKTFLTGIRDQIVTNNSVTP